MMFIEMCFELLALFRRQDFHDVGQAIGNDPAHFISAFHM